MEKNISMVKFPRLSGKQIEHRHKQGNKHLNILLLKTLAKGGMAELVVRPPTDPKVCGSNHRGPEYW
jgi:hypothetical protein